MKVLFQITPGLLALSLAASLVACSNENAAPAEEAGAAPQGQVVATDCRSPNAQTTQRGCRPATRMLGSL